jgi:hypothetical protein
MISLKSCEYACTAMMSNGSMRALARMSNGSASLQAAVYVHHSRKVRTDCTCSDCLASSPLV